MINSLFTGNRNSLLAWPWLFPDKTQDQPVFPNSPMQGPSQASPMPFEGTGPSSKGSGVMAGGMPYPPLGQPMTGYGGMYGGPGPMSYTPYSYGGGPRKQGMAIRNKY